MGKILSKSDFKEFVDADRAANRYKSIPLLKWIYYYLFRYDDILIMALLYSLRRYEYAVNTRSIFKCMWYLLYIYHSNKTRIHLIPNRVGKGLRIPHSGGGIIVNADVVGDYCTINANVIVGDKFNGRPSIGNNVELCIGCAVIGKVFIDDDCIVAPNTVVIKDVKKGSIVSGVPAKVISTK